MATHRCLHLQAWLLLAAVLFPAYVDGAEPALRGVWQLFKDDKKAADTLPRETMSFGSDHAFLMDGDQKYIGRYALDGDRIKLIIAVNGREVIVPLPPHLLQGGVHRWTANFRRDFRVMPVSG